VQSTPPVVEGWVREAVKLGVFGLQVVQVVAAVEEDENSEAEAEAPEPVAQDNLGSFGGHTLGHTAGPFLEVAAGEEYGIEEEGYVVAHWSKPNVDEAEGETVD